MNDDALGRLAMNIVFQIGDLFSDFGDRKTRDKIIDLRQATNDKAIDFTKKLIQEAVAAALTTHVLAGMPGLTPQQQDYITKVLAKLKKGE